MQKIENKIKGAIFDLDGVLVDTAKYHYLAWKKLAEKLGFVPNKAGKILAARKQPITFACLLPDKDKNYGDHR